MTFSFVESGVDPLACLEDGIRAEKAGFDTFWIPDHYVDLDPSGERLEPWTALSAIAARTERIRLGSGVTDTQRTHPTRTAHAVACLDFLSRGRATLGIGAGEAMNVVPFGLPWESPEDRLKRLEEAVRVVGLLWESSADNPKSFAGRFFNLEGAHLGQAPVQKPRPPIYVGAIASRRALEVVGRLGDGWFGWVNTPRTFRERMGIVRESGRSSDRSSTGEIGASTSLLVAFPRNPEESKEALLFAKLYLVIERSVLRSLGGDYHIEVPQYQNLAASRENLKRVMDVASSIPDELVHRVAAIGGIEEVREKVEALSGAGAKELAVTDLTPPRNVTRIMEVFPRLIEEFR